MVLERQGRTGKPLQRIFSFPDQEIRGFDQKLEAPKSISIRFYPLTLHGVVGKVAVLFDQSGKMNCVFHREKKRRIWLNLLEICWWPNPADRLP